MSLQIKAKPIKAPIVKEVASDLVPSVKIKVYDIPIENIVLSEENPNTQDDKTLDALVQSIQTDGFCEPVQVVPIGDGKYRMVSGEHRYKALRLLKWKVLPAVIHNDWDDTQRKIGLVKYNQLRGKINPEKFAKLYNDMVKTGVDKELLKHQMGFVESDAFEKIYKNAEKNLSPKQKKQLAEAKEKIKSVDDLSSVLNTIFTDHGSELDAGFMVFSFGGKNHHYIKIDAELDKILTCMEKEIKDSGVEIKDAFKKLFKTGNYSDKVIGSKPKLKVRPKP